jgi:hypothetical protein
MLGPNESHDGDPTVIQWEDFWQDAEFKATSYRHILPCDVSVPELQGFFSSEKWPHVLWQVLPCTARTLGRGLGSRSRIFIIWDVTQCTPLKVNRRFGGTCRLRDCLLHASCYFLTWLTFQPRRWRQHVFPKKTDNFQRTTWRYIPYIRTVHDQSCENVKFYRTDYKYPKPGGKNAMVRTGLSCDTRESMIKIVPVLNWTSLHLPYYMSSYVVSFIPTA